MKENIFLLKHTIERLFSSIRTKNLEKFIFFPRQTISFVSDKFKRKVKIEIDNTLEKYWEINDAGNSLRNYLFEITLPIVVVRVIATPKNTTFATVYGTRNRKNLYTGSFILVSISGTNFLFSS